MISVRPPSLSKAQRIPRIRVATKNWKKYLGTYSLVYNGLDPKWYTKLVLALGYHPQKLEVYQENQVLKIRSQDGVSILREYKEGMFFTVEPMVNVGSWQTIVSRFDGWTVTTRDKTLSAQFAPMFTNQP